MFKLTCGGGTGSAFYGRSFNLLSDVVAAAALTRHGQVVNEAIKQKIISFHNVMDLIHLSGGHVPSFKGERNRPQKTIINIQQLVVKHREIHYNANSLDGSENSFYVGAKLT